MDRNGRKTGGRKKGTPNKVTSDTRYAVQEVVLELLKGAKADLAHLTPGDRMKALTALLPFVCPKMAEVNQEITAISPEIGELRIGFDDDLPE